MRSGKERNENEASLLQGGDPLRQLYSFKGSVIRKMIIRDSFFFWLSTDQ